MYEVVVNLDVAGSTAVGHAVRENTTIRTGVVSPDNRRLSPTVHATRAKVCEGRHGYSVVFHKEIAGRTERRGRRVAIDRIDPLEEITTARAVDGVMVGYAIHILFGGVLAKLKDGLISGGCIDRVVIDAKLADRSCAATRRAGPEQITRYIEREARDSIEPAGTPGAEAKNCTAARNGTGRASGTNERNALAQRWRNRTTPIVGTTSESYRRSVGCGA